MSGCFPWNRRGSRHGDEAWVAFPWDPVREEQDINNNHQEDTEFLAIVRHACESKVASNLRHLAGKLSGRPVG
jgi:hypothetical protein